MNVRPRPRPRSRPVLLVLAVALFLSVTAAGAASAAPTREGTAKAGTAAPGVATAVQGITCARPRDGDGEYTGEARCPVTSGTWQYFQAYLTNFTAGCAQDPSDTATIRMQVLARRGGTGVHIGGVWVVYQDGPRRYGTMKFSAVDGTGTSRNGSWNHNGGWSTGDSADLYSNGSDPIRYPELGTSAFVGLTSTPTRAPYFAGYFLMANNSRPHLADPSQCVTERLVVTFTG